MAYGNTTRVSKHESHTGLHDILQHQRSHTIVYDHHATCCLLANPRWSCKHKFPASACLHRQAGHTQWAAIRSNQTGQTSSPHPQCQCKQRSRRQSGRRPNGPMGCFVGLLGATVASRSFPITRSNRSCHRHASSSAASLKHPSSTVCSCRWSLRVACTCQWSGHDALCCVALCIACLSTFYRSMSHLAGRAERGAATGAA